MKVLIVVGCGLLGACAAAPGRVNSTVLAADKSIGSAEVAFQALQNAALAGIENGVIKGATKAIVIDLIDKGQHYEDEAIAGRDVANNGIALATVVAQLASLGVKP